MNTAIFGCLWGDEGKGKVVDYISENADIVVRTQGGNNAGHTIVIGKQVYKLNLLPSGVTHPKCMNILTNGMVIDPVHLLKEIENIENVIKRKVKLLISKKAHVILSYHIELDSLNETLKGDDKIGSTKRGIGPCYEDKAARTGVRIGDLTNKVVLRNRIEQSLRFKNILFKHYDQKVFDIEVLTNDYYEIGKKIEKYMGDTDLYLNDAIKEKKRILFEGAQGGMLCLEHGSYPFVTSSSPLPNAISLNAGINNLHFDKIIAVSKAYVTRVGNGFFPSEFENDIAKKIREVGNEYGTVTRRPRRIGWLDLVVLKYMQQISNYNSIALMLVDVLSNIKEIKVCIGYDYKGKRIDYVPSELDEYAKCKPLYETLAGWEGNISNIRQYEDLPLNCQKYIKFIENFLNTKVGIISVGPDREQTIIIE